MAGQAQTFGKGRTLFRQGEKGGDLYFIQSGRVDLIVKNEDTGAEAIVATAGDRSVLGTMSFLEDAPRSATGVTKTEVQCVIINQAQKEKMLQSIPAWVQVLIKDLSANLRRTNESYTKAKTELDSLRKKYEAKSKQLAQLKEEATAAN